jgi:hypothetical protein
MGTRGPPGSGSVPGAGARRVEAPAGKLCRAVGGAPDLNDDVVWVPLWAMKVSTPMRKWVKGFTFNPIYMAWNNLYDLHVER